MLPICSPSALDATPVKVRFGVAAIGGCSKSVWHDRAISIKFASPAISKYTVSSIVRRSLVSETAPALNECCKVA